MNLRMAGKNLLDERASGARHAQHEHGRRGWMALSLQAIEQAAIEYFANALEQLERVRFLIIGLLVFQCIALAQMFKSPSVISNVIQRFRQRKMDVVRLIRW